ncbi:MAG: SDR family oxidoreductase [Crocinitomicaceae bacterium]|nr:SDR family oxidoreductase [Crocinitomicaceae bacterium]
MATVLIIGGSSGIGYKLSHMLADQGHDVLATYNKNEISSEKSNLVYHKLNVLDAELNFNFLPAQIDALVYCPGSVNLKPFHRIKPEEFTRDFELQVTGAVKIIQALLPNLKQAAHPAIVLFSTVAVQSGFNFHSQVSASKGAIEGLTHALAAEFAPKIRVNCVAPSLTDTPLTQNLISTDEKRTQNDQRHPLKRIGKAEDIANAVEFLISEKSSWITGQVLHVDGGMSSLKL